MERSTAVIGAGPAGLAAAWGLAEAGRRVTVYEARAVPGGRLRTEAVAGSSADAVVQLLSDGYTETLALLSGLGLRDRLVAVPGRDAMWRRGRAHGLQYGSVVSMAASGALPAGLKLRLGMRYVPFLDRHAEALDLNDPGRGVGAGLDGESIGAWGRRELGDDFVELMAYPLLASYYGVTPEETSAAVFHGLARAGMHVSLLGAPGGMGALARSVATALAERGVEIRYRAEVTGLEAGPTGVAVSVGGGTSEHEAAVVAVPAGAAARLVPGAGWLGEVSTRSTAMLILGLAERLATGWFGLTIPRREPPGDVLAAVCVQSEKGTGLAGAGDALLVIPAPGVGARWVEADVEAVLAEAMPAVERVLPAVRGRVAGHHLVPLRDQVFVPEPGHFTRMAALAPDRLPHRLALAGDYLSAPTVEGAVRSGLAAARRVTAAAA